MLWHFQFLTFFWHFQIPHQTCQPYDAEDHAKVDNCLKPNLEVCRDCTWPPPKVGKMGNCWPKTNFTRYFVSDYTFLEANATHIKKELFKNGPIGTLLLLPAFLVISLLPWTWLCHVCTFKGLTLSTYNIKYSSGPVWLCSSYMRKQFTLSCLE